MLLSRLELINDEFIALMRTRIGSIVDGFYTPMTMARLRSIKDEFIASVPKVGITTHAFDVLEFNFAIKDFEKRLFLGGTSIFSYSKTQVSVFYQTFRGKKTKKILLNGFSGASRFDFQIQLTRFLPKDANIIDITISNGDSSLLVVFLPRVYTPKDKHRCPLLTVDTKTGETSSKRITFCPSTYNPLLGWTYNEEIEVFQFL